MAERDFYELVSKAVSYDPDTGGFLWNSSRGRRSDLCGSPAGSLNNKGYLRIMLDGKAYQAHRLAFLLMTGRMPAKHIDHVNGVRTDNRWANLREVDFQGNGQNQRLRKGNKLGITGVYWCEKRQSFQACIGINESGRKKNKSLGRHKSLFEAACSRKSAEIKYGFHANHGKKAEVA